MTDIIRFTIGLAGVLLLLTLTTIKEGEVHFMIQLGSTLMLLWAALGAPETKIKKNK